MAVLVSLLVLLGLAAGGAYGVFQLTRDGTPAAEAPTYRAEATPTPTRAPNPTPTPAPSPTAPAAWTGALLQPGDRGVKVRELQHRLFQLEWFTPPLTGEYDRATRVAVRGFQDKRGFQATGAVDRRTWRRLVAMSRAPSRAELSDRVGPVLFAPGDTGPGVREIQARLRQIAWFFGNVSDTYGDATTEAVSGFQAKRGVPVTGTVDRRTLALLEGMTTEPTADELANRRPDPADGAPLDPRCTTGRALCIDKSSSSLRWVVDGTVRMSLDVRFGASYSPTREGLFHVGYKDADHVSSLYGSAMPYSMFFSGGQAVHYSSDFAARGYAGASHGCVNVRDYDELAWLFGEVRVGDKVVVYWS